MKNLRLLFVSLLALTVIFSSCSSQKEVSAWGDNIEITGGRNHNPYEAPATAYQTKTENAKVVTAEKMVTNTTTAQPAVADENAVASTEKMVVASTAKPVELTEKEVLAEIEQALDDADVSKVKKAVVMTAIKAANAAKPASSGEKSQLVALILCFVVGTLGIHRFYLGYIGIGIIQLVTAGGCGIWTLIDFINILLGNLEPKDGSYDKELDF